MQLRESLGDAGLQLTSLSFTILALDLSFLMLLLILAFFSPSIVVYSMALISLSCTR